jgi:hypothetical protein
LILKANCISRLVFFIEKFLFLRKEFPLMKVKTKVKAGKGWGIDPNG